MFKLASLNIPIDNFLKKYEKDLLQNEIKDLPNKNHPKYQQLINNVNRIASKHSLHPNLKKNVEVCPGGRVRNKYKAKSLIEMYKNFITPEMVKKIVQCTNSASSFAVNLTEAEVYAWIGLRLLAVVSDDRIKDLWNKSHSKSVYSSVLSRCRYKVITANLKFENEKNKTLSINKPYEIKQLSEMFARQCRKVWVPSQEVLISNLLFSFSSKSLSILLNSTFSFFNFIF